jgi:hypothetical protein
VQAKAAGTTTFDGSFLESALRRFTTDGLVAALTGVALVSLVVLGRRATRVSFPAVVLVVSAACHVLFARMGWYERYQAYLIALGVYAALELMADRLSAGSRPPARSWVVPGLVAVALLFTGSKPAAVFKAHEAVEETYDQRYQVARFLDRYYDGEPVATGELGYVSLAHDGPLTDVFGLGDYEVLQEWQRADDRPGPTYWRELAERRGVDVVALYPQTLGDDIPEEWIHVGEWDLDRWITTAPSPVFTFYATNPDGVQPLREHLEEFGPELPDGVVQRLNELAAARAAELRGDDPSAEATTGVSAEVSPEAQD